MDSISHNDTNAKVHSSENRKLASAYPSDEKKQEVSTGAAKNSTLKIPEIQAITMIPTDTNMTEITKKKIEGQEEDYAGGLFSDGEEFYRHRGNLPARCLSQAMLVPSDRVDLTGRTCDVIGTSTFTWAHGGGMDFCSGLPGHCMANQIGKLRRVRRLKRKSD